MKKILFALYLMFSIPTVYGNLLYDITDGKFRVKPFDVPRSMNDGDHYTQLVDNKAVVKYNYRTGATVDTLFSISRLKDAPFKSISGYELSPNENRMLVYTNVTTRYRRSYTAEYFVYDIKRNEIDALSEHVPQEAPHFSPDSRYIAFAHNNNLHIKKLDFKTEIPITKDGEKGKIINGIADWIYEEEFAQTRYFEWSPDSKLLAFIKFNETNVPEFSFQIFKNPNQNDGLTLYPLLEKFKYPKAGDTNPTVTVCVYDDFEKTTRVMQMPKEEGNFYIPRIRWTMSADQLAVFKLNRNQNQLDMLLVNPRSTLSRMVLRQEDKHYVDYENIDYLTFTSDNQFFINVSEKDGYRHAYLHRMNGTVVKQLTRGNWDVTEIYGYDESKKTLYYQSAEVSPMQRDIYALDDKGRKTRLTDGKGYHVAYFNRKFTLFIDDASTLSSPNTITLRNVQGVAMRSLEKNENIAQEFSGLQLSQKEFIQFNTSESISLNGWILKPQNFDANKQYPLLLIQYSGPNSQQVLDRWNIGWEYYLAQTGIVVACIDGRGTGARGAEFRKCTYQQMGILEAKDQIEAAKYFGNQPFIDKNRIGIWGWSYGGSTVLWSMSTGESIFKAGISVAPVTDWRLYNTAYTERFMRRPQENFKGYEQTSAIENAEKLNGNLLIIHGSADDNVHVQNTMLYIDKLVEAGKQFEMQIYTDKNHSITGKQTRRHLYTRMSNFLLKNL